MTDKPKQKRRTRQKKGDRNYVNNKDFTSAVINHIQAIRAADESEQERPEMPRYIAECIMKIAERLSTSHNFVGYTYRDEMVADGIENCLLYFDRFNDKIENPNAFAYYTQICYYAFVRRIKQEKKQHETKIRYMKNVGLVDILDGEDIDQNNQLHTELNHLLGRVDRDFDK